MLHGQEREQEQRDTPQDALEAPLAPDHGTGPLHLYVAGDAAAFGGLVHALENQGLRLAGALEDVETRLREDALARAVIVYPNPVMVLGAKLQAEEAMADSLQGWRESTERLLTLFRRDRRRITLLDGNAAQCAPGLLSQLLGARLSLSIAIAEDAGASQPDTEPAGLPHLVAAQVLRQDDAVATLIAELEASSLPLGPAYRVDVDAIVADGLAGEGRSEIDALGEENELLLLQLHQVQEELEAHFLESRKLIDAETHQARADARQARADVQQARAETKQARLARNSLQAEFNEARRDWKAERKVLTDKLKWSANDLAAIRRSLSWRVTAPLRRVLGLFVGGSKL